MAAPALSALERMYEEGRQDGRETPRPNMTPEERIKSASKAAAARMGAT